MRWSRKYVWVNHNNCCALEHVVIAERAIGKPLPHFAEVHHVDFNGTNNVRENLVVCPSRSYHRLLHLRTNALSESGNANFLKCRHCKTWDDPLNMKTWPTANGMVMKAHHVACNRAYQKDRYDPVKKKKQRDLYRTMPR